MPRSSTASAERILAEVPEGAPAWITPDLISQTLKTWQPYYPEALTERDALEILLHVGQLLEVLEDGDEQAISGVGESI